MLMRAIMVLLICFLSNCVAGCNYVKDITTGDISIVKAGTLEMDKSLTVGQAIDNYKYFKKVKWEAKKTENGKRLVYVYGDVSPEGLPSTEIKSSQIQLQFGVNTDKSIGLVWCGAAVEKSNGTRFGQNEGLPMVVCMKTMKSIYDNGIIGK